MNNRIKVINYKILGYQYYNDELDKMIELYIGYTTAKNPTLKLSFNVFCIFNEKVKLYEIELLDIRFILHLLLEDDIITKINDKYYLKQSTLLMLI
jgi:hypothetical protein